MITTAAYLLGVAYEEANLSPDERRQDKEPLEAVIVIGLLITFMIFDYITISKHD